MHCHQRPDEPRPATEIMSESIKHLMHWGWPMSPLALAAMMMPAAGFSTTNPPGGSSTCTNSCDCHSSFSNDPPTPLIPAAPRPPPPVLVGATTQGFGKFIPCQFCEMKSAIYNVTEGKPCHKDLTDRLRERWNDFDERNFEVGNKEFGDICVGQAKELDIETTFWDGSSPWYSRPDWLTRHWTAPENKKLELDKICCTYYTKGDPTSPCMCSDGTRFISNYPVIDDHDDGRRF